MNHLLVGDTIWLRRFAGHPASYSTLAHLLEQPPVSGDAKLWRRPACAAGTPPPSGRADSRLVAAGHGRTSGPGFCLPQYQERSLLQALRQPGAALLQPPDPPSRPDQHPAVSGRRRCGRDRPAGMDTHDGRTSHEARRLQRPALRPPLPRRSAAAPAAVSMPCTSPTH
jgi:hypothetical protein